MNLDRLEPRSCEKKRADTLLQAGEVRGSCAGEAGRGAPSGPASGTLPRLRASLCSGRPIPTAGRSSSAPPRRPDSPDLVRAD